MGLDFNFEYGQTLLDDEEREGLNILSITTRGELDEFEQQNIEEAIQWSISNTFKPQMVLSIDFIKKLHKKMFLNVWKWAGEFRKSNKNIGCEWYKVANELGVLMDDAKFWFEHSVYAPDEFAIRFKHRLVSIHCFPNGNGRHSRLLADIIIEHLFKQQVFSWGANLTISNSEVRAQYLMAMKRADQGELDKLIAFARS